MTTRVIGRGKCSKCGEEGSVVFKEISGKVYVYVKHGRKWCYIGPLENVDLTRILVSLSDYHYFTTKINEYVNKVMKVGGMRITTLLFINILLIILSYAISLSSAGFYGYDRTGPIVVSQIIVIITVFVSLITVSLYELRYRKTIELMKPLERKHVLKQLVLIITTTTMLFIFYPLLSTINIEKRIILESKPNYTNFISLSISLSCILMTALILAILVRSVSNSSKKYVINAFSSSITGSLMFLLLITMISYAVGGVELNIGIVLPQILTYSIEFGLALGIVSIIYFLAISLFKKIMILETS